MKTLVLTVWMWACSVNAASSADAAQHDHDIESIAEVLDTFHGAAAIGDWTQYFRLMSNDGVFIGTDASERWTKHEFRAYASDTDGWQYTPSTRNINLTPSGDSAWFDEILDSADYGTSRGTGVLIRTNDGWKISQYHLTFPIPNPLASRITAEIRHFEQEQAAKKN